MSPPLLPVLLALVLLAASDVSGSREVRAIKHNKISRKVELPAGCLYGGRWHGEGAVRADACLACVCVRGALACRRRACAPPPDPPPGCRLRHAPGACCPEMHCADGVIKLDQGASARLDDFSMESMSQGVVLPACVEGGTVYAAGSAMAAGVACEQCFCLGGSRRCVRPRCLPPPPACRALPAPGACCPQRYFCDHVDTTPPHSQNHHDCQTEDGQWIREGEKVPALSSDKCTQCFCLGGKILCQSLSCEPKLKGCTPLVLPGQCCPHKYICNERNNNTILNLSKQDNFLVPLNENRSFHTSKSAKRETTVKAASSNSSKKPTSTTTTTKQATTTTTTTPKPTTTTTATKPKNTTMAAKPTTKAKPAVKTKNTTTTKPTTMTNKNVTNKEETIAKSSTSNSETSSNTIRDQKSTITTTPVPKVKKEITTKLPTTITEETTTPESFTESTSTEQPERSIKIIINGTVNCTTELSSSTLLLNTTNTNDSVWINTEIHPRIPMFNKEEIEAHTSLPNEIITNGVYNEEFDENETFTINVTSSLRTNTSSPALSTTTTSTTPRPKTVPPIMVDGANASKSKKDELDFDYNEPTLPPSLPNLKIIPFVAADAVVDDETSPKENIPFTSAAQEEKYPVYYPGLETKEHEYPIRREDDYNTNQYPIFVSKKEENKNYPSLTNFDNFNADNVNLTDVMLSGMQQFMTDKSSTNKVDSKTAESSIGTSGISGSSLFSPPAETEGGFLPKGPGAIDEYYSMYPSTPAGPVVPHLTTSMQIDTKEGCVSSTGQRIGDGASIEMGCSLCICAWSELHCSPRPCHTPPGCRWRTASIHSHDLCCGELICDYDTKYPAVTTNSSKPIGDSPKSPSKNTDGDKDKKEPDVITFNNKVNLRETEIENKVTGNNESHPVNSTSLEIVTQQPPLITAKFEANTTKTAILSEPTINSSSSQSLEYEDEEDDDEGFSLGSVLKLLLSESYDTKTTTLSPNKKTTLRVTEKTFRSTTPRVNTTPKDFFDTHNEFIPMSPSIVPFKKIPMPNPITRIDHLLLGESNAIRDPRLPTTTKPPPTTRRYTVKTTQPPYTSKPTTKIEIATEATRHDNEIQPVEIAQPPQPFGLGLLKLAGCNIYGQMYRVGRIITELSTPCQECRCTEFGVHCTPLGC